MNTNFAEAIGPTSFSHAHGFFLILFISAIFYLFQFYAKLQECYMYTLGFTLTV